LGNNKLWVSRISDLKSAVAPGNFLLCLLFVTEDGGDMFFRNVGYLKTAQRYNPEDPTLDKLCFLYFLLTK
jgi:hypothetical protein